jgi:Tol biopolymer transport system component
MDFSSSWSPDGLYLVYQSTHNGEAGIYVVDALGQDPHRLTGDTSNQDGSPAWSPVP